MSVELFRDDDQGYFTWVAVNPGGYVLNIQRSLNPSDARVHETGCRTITGTPPRGRTWTGPYVKACSPSLSELGAGARHVNYHPMRDLPAVSPACSAAIQRLDQRNSSKARARSIRAQTRQSAE